MDAINALLPLEVSLPGRPEPAATRIWRTGQVLHAVVVDRPALDVAALRVGGTELRARTLVPLAPGEQLTLRVERAGDSVALRILDTTPRNPVDEAATLARAMRVALPHEIRLDAALERLAAATGGKAGGNQAPVNTPNTPQARAVLQMLVDVPRPTSLTETSGLRQAVRDSGVFLEARLATLVGRARLPGELATLIGRAQAPAEITTDFKAQVLRVLAMLAPSHDGTSMATRAAMPEPSALARPDAPTAPGASPNPGSAPELAAKLTGLLEGALHRVQSHQLASLAARDNGAPAWHFELPVRLGQEYDAVKLRVGREPSRQGHDEDATWTVNLALSPGALGPMHVRVTLSGLRISSTLWAERPETADLARGRLEELRTGLDGAGFDVGRMQCLDGCPPAARTEPPGELLRVRA